ncbi:SRPBCC family protein [Phenylobacterium sp.]|uniref:SRPBCC family protein n=1 Tax=Phenylobacterium sp. TaxID=1871053 RepID=UPI002DEE7612|nr:SRPBCC family protein [Phenylobacterium sp.]
MGSALALLASLTTASAAGAVEISPREQAVLDRGRAYVEVRSDPDGVSGLIRAAIDIAAPPEVVFKVITDCDLAPKMVDSLKSCRIVERDPAGRWDVREEISKMTFVPSVRNVFRSDYEPPERVRFHRVGGDLMVFEGEWRIEPHGAGSRVFYENRAGAPFRVPGYLARIALRFEVPQALQALRRESVARVR